MFNNIRLKRIIIAAGMFVTVLLVIFLIRDPKVEKDSVDAGSAPRPDILAWIEKHYGHDHRKKTALLRLAEGYQHIVALECYFIAFEGIKDRIDGMPTYEALAAQSFNTYARGKVLGLAEVKSWEEQCEKPLWP